ncbi:hypothetical protein [Haloarchaeobius sp. DYHT-AS-18]|uniref:hypothetical protein n=1 Tax=Haloarchaeobius sp. DYHT-AS-18 TaxID=3446117 RepID=UPI003EBE4AA1
MDGDGGGTDGVSPGVLNGGNVAGRDHLDGEPTNSESSVLQSLGYTNDHAGMDRAGGDAANSRIETLKMVILNTVLLFVGLNLLYFLLSGILAMFGVRL